MGRANKSLLTLPVSKRPYMSLVVRKPVFGVSDQVPHKPGCTVRKWLVTRNFVSRKQRDCTIRVAKTKALISFAVTAKLIYVYVFAYAKTRFSHNEAHMVQNPLNLLLQNLKAYHLYYMKPGMLQ